MAPITQAGALRATAAGWCRHLADKLGHVDTTWRLEVAARDATDLAAVRTTVARLTGEVAQSRDAAEAAMDDRDAARSDLRDVARLLAERHVIVRAPHLACDVLPTVRRALGDDVASGAPLANVVAELAAAAHRWTNSSGRPHLFDAECTELSWVLAAAISGWLRDDLAGILPTPDPQPATTAGGAA